MGATNGRSDAAFVADVRRILRDQPVVFAESQPTDGVTGSTLVAGSKPFRLQRAPVITSGLVITAPGGDYHAGNLNGYLPAFDQPASLAPGAPILADLDAAGSLPAGDYQVFWTLGNGANPGALSLPSPLSNVVTVAINHRLTVTNLPSPIPAPGIYFWFVPLATTGANSWGFAQYYAANDPGPYIVGGGAVGNGISPVFINSDTGELSFGLPPAVGTLAVTYQAVRYSDTQVLAALYEGLQLLWPDIWNPTVNTTAIGISPTQYEYPLPADFQDQRCILLSVEYAPPSGIVRYFKTSMWRTTRDTVNPLLVFSRIPPVAYTVRLTYSAPLGGASTVGTLGSTPTEAAHLPTYYALARLLVDQDTMRVRSDDLPALTGEAAQQPGASIATANYWLQQFSTQLSRLALDQPVRMMITHRAVERLGLSSIWTDLE